MPLGRSALFSAPSATQNLSRPLFSLLKEEGVKEGRERVREGGKEKDGVNNSQPDL